MDRKRTVLFIEKTFLKREKIFSILRKKSRSGSGFSRFVLARFLLLIGRPRNRSRIREPGGSVGKYALCFKGQHEEKQMKVQVAVCNESHTHMIGASRQFCTWVQSNFDVRDVCSDGVRLHSSKTDLVDALCNECRFWRIAFRRIDNWNVRVSLKAGGDAYGFWIA